MNVKRCADCGNSPKNGFVEDVAVALLGADQDAASGKLARDAVLEIVGATLVAGRDEIVRGLSPADSLEVASVVSHGRAGAVSGILTRKGATARFSMVMRFTTAKADAVSLIEIYSPTPHFF